MFSPLKECSTQFLTGTVLYQYTNVKSTLCQNSSVQYQYQYPYNIENTSTCTSCTRNKLVGLRKMRNQQQLCNTKHKPARNKLKPHSFWRRINIDALNTVIVTVNCRIHSLPGINTNTKHTRISIVSKLKISMPLNYSSIHNFVTIVVVLQLSFLVEIQALLQQVVVTTNHNHHESLFQARMRSRNILFSSVPSLRRLPVSPSTALFAVPQKRVARRDLKKVCTSLCFSAYLL